MEGHIYHFEVRDLITQFVAAFDGAVIKRYNLDRQAQQNISVRYVLGSKQRVVYDIANASQNITLPAVAISTSNLRLDRKRSFNKINDLIYPGRSESVNFVTPTPVNLTVDISIIAKSISDLEQIIHNFAVFCNPYFVIAWKVPEQFGLESIHEIRSKVIWNENVTYEYPLDLTHSQKYEIIGNTSFEIEGWLFRTENEPVKNIFEISANFHALSGFNLSSSYSVLSSETLQSEYVTLSAQPQLTNVIWEGSDITEQDIITFAPSPRLLVLGKQFLLTRNVILSGTNSMFPFVSSFDYIREHEGNQYSKFHSVTGYPLPLSAYSVITDNTLSIGFPLLSSNKFDVIIENEAGWCSISQKDVLIDYRIGV